MATLQKIYEDIFNKSRFLAQENYFTPIDTHSKCWQKLTNLDDTINQLPTSVHEYIAHLCSFYTSKDKNEHMAISEKIEKKFGHLNATLKKVCEVYAIGLLVCDDLLTRINFLNVNKKLARVTIPTISYNNACSYLSWIGNLLQNATDSANNTGGSGYSTFQLDDNEITLLNCYAKLLTSAYNSSALGIFRKQPVRQFHAEEISILA